MNAEERRVTGDLQTKVEWIQALIPLGLAALAIPEPFGLFKMLF
jgi:alkylation response protein AidB-like acyl-CoA dehydrogenase